MVQNYDATAQSVAIASPGATLGTDWEQRVDFARLRAERAAKVRDALASSEIGALILFDMNNIRYVTSTHIGNWARDKLFRCCLVMRGEEPILWDIGSAARTHQAFAPWNARQNWRAGISSWRGSIPEEVGVERGNARRLAGILRDHGLDGEPVGVDVVELPGAARTGGGGPGHHRRARVHAGYQGHQDRRRDRSARPFRRPRGRRLRRAVPVPAGGCQGERLRRAGDPLPVRERLGRGRGGQLDFR